MKRFKQFIKELADDNDDYATMSGATNTGKIKDGPKSAKALQSQADKRVVTKQKNSQTQDVVT